MSTTEQDLDTTAVFHPDTYVHGVPHELFARLRRAGGVVWVPEPPVDGWPPGTGYWAVLNHPDAETVLRTPSVSLWLSICVVIFVIVIDVLEFSLRPVLGVGPTARAP